MREKWVVDFYAGELAVNEKGQQFIPADWKPVETVDVERAYAPTRWASNHALMLRRKHQGAKITFSIEKIS